MEKLSERFMFYAGLLVSMAVTVDVDVRSEDLKHISDLLEAEEQGLLLKLHFGIGDVVYEVIAGADGECFVIARKCRTYALLCTLNEKVGKTVFLTKAEAEKALAEMEK